MAMWSGALATFYWLLQNHAEHTHNLSTLKQFEAMQTGFGYLYSDFVFYPSFLLIGYASFCFPRCTSTA